MGDEYRIDITETGYRVSLVGSDQHTHLKSKSGAESAVRYVTSKKIPRRVSGYYLTSLMRLSTDEAYIQKIQELLDSRKSKGKKLNYYNPRKKNNK